MNEIIIDPMFENLIPAMSKEEFNLLEKTILAEGCRDPLIVWAGENILLDGHNRYKICVKHNLPYNTKQLELDGEDDAKKWILTNQLSRRNLSPDALSRLRGELYNLTKKDKNDGGRGKERSVCQNDSHLSTAEEIAVKTGVSESTILRDGQYAEAIDKLTEIAPELTKQISEGTAPAKQVIIEASKIASLDPVTAKEILSTKPDHTPSDKISLHVKVIEHLIYYHPVTQIEKLVKLLKQYNPSAYDRVMLMPTPKTTDNEVI